VGTSTAGVLVATFDHRQTSAADLPNVIDVQTSRSTDGGLTWSAPAIVAAHTGGNTTATAIGRGDACLTYNNATGRIFCHYILSPVGVGLAASDNTTANGSTTTLNCCYRYSDDGGVTWSAEVNFTSTVKTSAMLGTSATSGHGFCDASGTVYVPYCYTDSGGARHDFVMSSADNGTTWVRSSIINSGVDEHHVVQRSDGTWLSDGRPVAQTSRQLYSATTVGGTWSGPITVVGLPDPKCNGDILRVSTDSTSPYATWLLSSACASTANRGALTVWLSKDNGVTWPVAWQVYPGGAAYSSMAVLPDGTFAIFWEDTDHVALSVTTFSLLALAY
jgi:sialidase-1